MGHGSEGGASACMEGLFRALTLHWWDMVCASGLGWHLDHSRSQAAGMSELEGTWALQFQVQFLLDAEGVTEAWREEP